MPSIVAVPYPDRGHVLLEINIADVPGATHACVEARHGDTVRQLHPYVSYNGSGCIATVCGQAILWDTELPCDTPVTYCVTAVNAAGDTITQLAPALITDTFTRVTANGWGTSDSGAVWTSTGGLAANYSTTGTRGQHAVTTVAVPRVSSTPMATPNAVAQATAFPAAVALTTATEQWLMLRADATAANGYRARLRYNTAGNVDLTLDRVVAGVVTNLGTAIAFTTYTAVPRT